MVNHPVKLRLGHLLAASQERNQSRIQITGAGAHHQTRRRCEAHAGIHALAIAHGGQAGAVAQMSEDDASARRFRAGDRFKFLHQKRIRQPVKAVSLNALGLVAARNRKQLRHARQGAVKRRVETGDLRHLGKLRSADLHQLDAGREMVRGKRTDAPQFLKHRLIHAERIAITRAAMHNAMADGADGLDADFFLQQLNQQWDAGNVIGCINHAVVALVREDVGKCQFGVGQSDSVELSDQNLRERFAHVEEREAKA